MSSAPAATLGGHPARWRRPSFFGSPARGRVALLLALAYVAWAIHGLHIDLDRIIAGVPRAINLFARMIPPDFARWELLLRGMAESLQMAFAATFAGVILSVPLGIAAARNLSPRPVYLAARALIVVGRTFHEIIIAIFFVKLFGFGPVAGLLTLSFASAIFLGKMLAEDIENVRGGPIEAVRATGAGFWQVVTYAVVPQVLSRTVGVAIYRLDANVRHSTVVGIVGAGGIGQTLSASFSRYDYDFTAAILLAIVLLVAIGEWFSDWVRGRMR
jgi:phosphonate transport system permease protein